MDEIRKKALSSNILIVDDNPANVELLEMMLNLTGYANVESTSDPREVEDLYRDGDFDLVLLDIRMPHKDGFQVMEELSDMVGDDYLPVLVLTAEKDMKTRIRALEAGAKDFVTKPFDRTEVLNRIANMLEVRILYKERTRQAEILEEKVRERTRELLDTRLEIIRRLGRAGEYRDNETGMHVVRMSKTSQLMAQALGLGDAYAERVLNASPMHDVGKIGIPDSILIKPGKLDPGEWEIMKTHVEIGADIIGEHDTELMGMARMIALTHHEKWDGSGYPKGLEGEDIPMVGRISAICDVFDALTSVRPYKKAWPIEKAVEFIHGQSGAHFDPRLVRLFKDRLRDILDIREKYADAD